MRGLAGMKPLRRSEVRLPVMSIGPSVAASAPQRPQCRTRSTHGWQARRANPRTAHRACTADSHQDDRGAASQALAKRWLDDITASKRRAGSRSVMTLMPEAAASWRARRSRQATTSKITRAGHSPQLTERAESGRLESGCLHQT
jgi:hypothetical protein